MYVVDQSVRGSSGQFLDYGAKASWETCSEPEPLYGDVGELDPSTALEVARRCFQLRSNLRKLLQFQRHAIRKNQHIPAVRAVIRDRYKTEVSEEVARYATSVCNPGEDVVVRVCQLYRRGAVRALSGPKVTGDQRKAFEAFVKESAIDTQAVGWSQAAYFDGPTFVPLAIRRGRLRMTAAEPHVTEVVLDIEDPTGDPVAVGYLSGKGRVTVIDGVYRWAFEMVRDAVVLKDRTEHGVELSLYGNGAQPEMPVSCLRFDHPSSPENYWTRDMHRRIVDGALDVAVLYARMGSVRKAQDHKLLALRGKLGALVGRQTTTQPEKPLLINLSNKDDSPAEVVLDLLDFVTDPEEFFAQIHFTIEQIAESTGVPTTVTPAAGGKWDYVFDHTALTELRNDQTSHARHFEAQNWTLAVALAKAQGHHLANDLPAPEIVAEYFQLILPPMSRAFADPKAQMDWWDWRMKRGVASVLDIAGDVYGPAPAEVLGEKMSENLAINQEWFDALARRNMQADPVDGKILTVPEMQGRLGPAVRDGKVPAVAGDVDDNTGASAGA